MTQYRLILLAIILLAFFLRVWQLPQTPPGLWYDEAYNAMDAWWMAETGDYQRFMLGNNGREPMWHYLLLWSNRILGNTTFAVRWVASVAGVLTIPIMYRFALALSRSYETLFIGFHTGRVARGRKWRDTGYARIAHIPRAIGGSFVTPARNRHLLNWFALAATGWLAVSWWHIQISRAGFRPVLLPPLLMLSLYFFWQGFLKVSDVAQPTTHSKQRALQYYPPTFAPSARIICSLLHYSLFICGLAALCFTHYAFPFILSGLFLGLAQYTYLPARLTPLIFGGLAILWTFPLYRRSRQRSTVGDRPSLKYFWLGIVMTVVIAGVVFAPLGLFFLNTPEAFFSRTGDVIFSPDTLAEAGAHLLQGLTIFWGAGHELYRHHLPGRAMLGWLEIVFFWVGLIWLLRPTVLRRPETQLVLLGLGVMWLPALLASPPVHSLRPIGMLPFYYIIVTVGLYHASRLTLHALRLTGRTSPAANVAFPLLAVIVITLTALINSYDYFWRWSNHPEVYKEYNGPLVDLTNHLIDLSQSRDVIIPFHLYAHPVTRYLLKADFTEVEGVPPNTNRPTEMLLIPDLFQVLFVGNIPYSPSLVWLTRDENGQGKIYISRPPRNAEQDSINEILASAQSQLQPFKDQLGREVALFAPITDYQLPITSLFDILPNRTTSLNWANLVELQGYDVTPEVAQPGQPITLNLYWHSLTDTTFDYQLFLQLVDRAGNPVNQTEEPAFSEDMYRWRPDGILPTQHTLWLGPDVAPGAYLVRLGFFDPRTGERLPLKIDRSTPESPNEDPAPVDQVHVGLFYVSPNGSDPRQPAAPLSANFADSIQLIGATLPIPILSQAEGTNNQLLISPSPHPSTELRTGLPISFHWQTLHPTDKPYTVFLQLLNQNGDVISGWDSQPFNGLYPTNRWSPGEIITDTFLLPLPEEGLPPGSYRLVTGFYDFDTGRRLPVVDAGDFAELGQFVVE